MIKYSPLVLFDKIKIQHDNTYSIPIYNQYKLLDEHFISMNSELLLNKSIYYQYYSEHYENTNHEYLDIHGIMIKNNKFPLIYQIFKYYNEYIPLDIFINIQSIQNLININFILNDSFIHYFKHLFTLILDSFKSINNHMNYLRDKLYKNILLTDIIPFLNLNQIYEFEDEISQYLVVNDNQSILSSIIKHSGKMINIKSFIEKFRFNKKHLSSFVINDDQLQYHNKLDIHQNRLQIWNTILINHYTNIINNLYQIFNSNIQTRLMIEISSSLDIKCHVASFIYKYPISNIEKTIKYYILEVYDIIMEFYDIYYYGNYNDSTTIYIEWIHKDPFNIIVYIKDRNHNIIDTIYIPIFWILITSTVIFN